MTAQPENQKVVWTFEMTEPGQLRAKYADLDGLEVKRVEIPSPAFSWFLHQVVGVDYRWGGREGWSEKEWTEHVWQPAMQTWVAYVSGAPAGYYEFEKQEDESVMIYCFGLLPAFIGRGIGAHLLTTAIEAAWACQPTRVWLKTCSHDHPHARKNYEARGFRVVSEKQNEPNAPRASALFGEPNAHHE